MNTRQTYLFHNLLHPPKVAKRITRLLLILALLSLSSMDGGSALGKNQPANSNANNNNVDSRSPLFQETGQLSIVVGNHPFSEATQPGDSISIPLSLQYTDSPDPNTSHEEMSTLGSLDVDLIYDQSILAVNGCQTTDAAAILECGAGTAGTVQLAAIAPQGIRVTTLATVTFSLLDSATTNLQIVPQINELFSLQGLPQTAATEPGTIELSPTDGSGNPPTTPTEDSATYLPFFW